MRRAFVTFACVTAALAAAPAGSAYTVNPHIAAFVQMFANGTPVVVRCPDSPEEWQFDLGGAENAQEIYGKTEQQAAVVEFRPDLCAILDNLAFSDADNQTKALAVLVLVHESYHVRHWPWRWNEARVQCQAIRHFRTGVRVLGGSRDLANLLFPFALSWHALITENASYRLDSCAAPRLRMPPPGDHGWG